MLYKRTHLHKMLFDHEHPQVSWAKEHYRDPDTTRTNLSEYAGLTGFDIADAILRLREKEEMLVLPERRYYGGDPYKHRRTGVSVPLDNSPRFRKFGPEINLTQAKTTIAEIKEQKLTPRKAFRQTLNNTQVREELRNGLYRGLGYWSPRSRRHNIIWFDVPAEGQAYLGFMKGEFRTEYQHADAYQQVPSYKQIVGPRIQKLLVLPVTGKDGEFYVEWLEEYVPCNCADTFYMGAKSKKKEHDTFEAIYKYINPEQKVCRHNWAQRLLAEEIGDHPKNTKLLVKLPRSTGYMSPWKKAKTQVFIREGGGLRRPLKPEVGTFCQYILGTLSPDEAFDLSED